MKYTKATIDMQSDQLMYYVNFDEDEDGDNIDYSVYSFIPCEYNSLDLLPEPFFSAEDEAGNFARANMSEIGRTYFGHMPLKLKGNCSGLADNDATRCDICGYPVSDGHWHEA